MARVTVAERIELAVHEAGRGDGRPAILLHGFASNAGVWSATAPALAPRFRVLMPDFRGHGASGRSDDPADYSLEQLADDVVQVADALGCRRFTLFGHGMGGDVAQLVVLEHPQRVEALVLVDTGPGPLDPQSGWAAGRAHLARVAAERGMEAAWHAYLETGIVGWEVDALPSEILESWRSDFLKTAQAAFVGLERSLSTQADRTPFLKEVACPTLVVVGEEDVAYRDAARALAEAIPGAELVVMEGSGHSPQIMHPEEFNEIVVDFLRRALPSGRGER